MSAYHEVDLAVKRYRRWHGVSPRRAMWRYRLAYIGLRFALWVLVGRDSSDPQYPEFANSIALDAQRLKRAMLDLYWGS